jgi:hypothetical protein
LNLLQASGQHGRARQRSALCYVHGPEWLPAITRNKKSRNSVARRAPQRIEKKAAYTGGQVK